ncbi:hypothetical protein [Rossellomorea vietnamensis]|uniref:hypothetical protein n=1 Tax=Rossellomorea vietnamensis TaxID=218284 RepID=UPI00077C728C|nr:hypothetical protein [Rossellomorea vietnamensis]
MNYFSNLKKNERELFEKYITPTKISAFLLIDKFYEKQYPTRDFEYSLDEDALNIEDLILIFLHENIFRSVLLYKTFINGILTKNPLQTSLGTRAQLETCGAVTYLHKKYNQFLKTVISEDNMRDELESLLLGVRNKSGLPSNGDYPDPKGVMKLIDSGDYFHKNILKRDGAPIRKIYEHLSEICHPNAYGYTLHSRDSVLDFKDPEGEFHETLYGINAFLVSMTVYIEAYEDLYSLISKNGCF